MLVLVLVLVLELGLVSGKGKVTVCVADLVYEDVSPIRRNKRMGKVG